MKKIYKILIGVIVLLLVSLAVVPQVYNYKINELIVNGQKEYEGKGLNTVLKSINDNYFNIKRKYIVTLSDSHYLFKNLKDLLSKKEINNIENLFNDTKLLVTVNLPKYPSPKKDAIVININQLSSNLEEELKNDKVGIQLLEFLKDDGIEFKFSSENLKINHGKLKDINLKLTNGRDQFTQIVKNFFIDFDDLNNYKLNIDLFDISFVEKRLIYNFQLDSFSYVLNKNDDLNGIEELSLKSFYSKFNEKYNRRNLGIEIDDLHSKNVLNTTQNLLNVKSDSSMKNINFSVDNNSVLLKDITTKISINNLNEQSIRDSITAIKNSDDLSFEYNMKKLLNEGFSFNLDELKVNSLNINLPYRNMKIDKIEIDSTVKLNPNNLLFDENIGLNLLNSLSSKFNISLLKDDLIQVNNQLNLPINIMNYIEYTKDKAYIHANFENNHLLINNKLVL